MITNSALWHWTSPVWLVAGGLLVGYLLIFRKESLQRLWLVLIAALLLVIAYVSPIGVLADGYLFSAHMVQHLLLLLIVPLFLLLSLPASTMRQWFRRGPLDSIGRILSIVAIGWICGVGAMWFWHVPTLCSAATQNASLSVIRDASFLAAGLAFWWPIYAPVERYRLEPLNGIAYLFSACLGCTLLGIYITFTTISVCPIFADCHDRIGVLHQFHEAGLTPAIDQNLGGLLMWVPPCSLYVLASISLLRRRYTTIDHVPSDVAAPA